MHPGKTEIIIKKVMEVLEKAKKSIVLQNIDQIFKG